MLAICTYIHTYACFFFCAEGAENNKISQPLQKRVEQMKSLCRAVCNARLSKIKSDYQWIANR